MFLSTEIGYVEVASEQLMGKLPKKMEVSSSMALCRKEDEVLLLLSNFYLESFGCLCFVGVGRLSGSDFCLFDFRGL